MVLFLIFYNPYFKNNFKFKKKQINQIFIIFMRYLKYKNFTMNKIIIL